MHGYRARHLKVRPKRRGPVVMATAATMSLTSTAAHAGTHVVRRGETLSAIASRHGTSVAKLARLNHLKNPNLIVVGQRLRMAPGSAGRRVHVVRSGETLSTIANRYGTSVNAIARANKIADANLIVVGQKLRVPAGGGGGGSSAAPRHVSAPSIASSLDHQARAHGVDPALVKAVAWQESGWQQNVRSSVGAIGVMQVMPATARWVNQVLGGHNLNIHVADDNVHLGVMYLRHLLDYMGGSVRKALAAYYSGPGNVGKHLNRGQKAYVASVLALRERF